MDVEEHRPIWRQAAVVEVAKTIAYALVIALFIRTFVFQPFNIPSSSMEGTLLVGDYLFVSKYSYGYSRYSLPMSESMPTFGRVFSGTPDRGDVAVFRFPPDPTQDYIKRVIGLPGDRVQVINSVLHINGQPVRLEPVGEGAVNCPDSLRKAPLFREILSNGNNHIIAQCNPSGAQNDTQEFVVPAGHYFMMGDNRDNSQDSRVSALSRGVGFVPEENLIGRAQIIFFSTDGTAKIWQFWKWPSAIRFGRLLNGIG